MKRKEIWVFECESVFMLLLSWLNCASSWSDLCGWLGMNRQEPIKPTQRWLRVTLLTRRAGGQVPDALRQDALSLQPAREAAGDEASQTQSGVPPLHQPQNRQNAPTRQENGGNRLYQPDALSSATTMMIVMMIMVVIMMTIKRLWACRPVCCIVDDDDDIGDGNDDDGNDDNNETFVNIWTCRIDDDDFDDKTWVMVTILRRSCVEEGEKSAGNFCRLDVFSAYVSAENADSFGVITVIISAA